MPVRVGLLVAEAVAVLPDEAQLAAPATGAAFDTAPASKLALVRTLAWLVVTMASVNVAMQVNVVVILRLFLFISFAVWLSVVVLGT